MPPLHGPMPLHHTRGGRDPRRQGRAHRRARQHAEPVRTGGVYTELYETQFKRAIESEKQTHI